MPGVEFEVSPVRDVEDYWRIMDVMREAWDMPDYTEAVPPHFMRAIADNGGLVLAAYTPEGEIVGFVLGILAREGGKLYHYSHMLGVRRAYRGTGVALALKRAQREWVISQGLDLVVWTYDPHQGLNARFNFAKLGVVCRRFYPNYYGTMRDGINRGMVSDRFKAEWWVTSERVRRRLEGESRPPTLAEVSRGAVPVVRTEVVGGVRRVVGTDLDEDSDLLLVEVPGDINALKRVSVDLANEWKLKLREVFSTYFGRGYAAIEFITSLAGGERRNFYLFYRGPIREVLDGGEPWR